LRSDKKRIDKLAVYGWLNIAVLLTALLSGFIISSAAEKYIAKEVFYIAPMLHGQKYFFSPDDLEELKEAYKPAKLSYLDIGSGYISYENWEIHCKIVYAGGPSFYLNNTHFIVGNAIDDAEENEHDIVINESLAWQLFGSLAALDKNVDIDGSTYTIVGVAAQKKVEKADCLAYLPFAPAYNEKVISSVLLQPQNYNKLGYYNINNWLYTIGKDERDYYIVDLDSYVESITLKNKILLLLISIYILAILFINSYQLLKLKYKRRVKRKFFTIAGVILLADLLLSIFLLKGISFDLWVPYGLGGRFASLVHIIINNTVLPGPSYLPDNIMELVKLNEYALTAFISGAFALLNIIFVLTRKWRHFTE